MWFVVIGLVVVAVLSYGGYKVYHRDKVPKDTPDIVDDIKNSFKKENRMKNRKD